MCKEQMLSEAVQRFGGDEKTLTLLGGFHENVYLVTDQEEYVLKLLFEPPGRVPYIKGELSWVKYLAENQIKVAKPLPSKQGRLVEEIQIGSETDYAIAFEKVKGGLVDPTNDQEWNQQLFEQWGQIMGKMHRLAKTYSPQDETIRYNKWGVGELYEQLDSEIDATIAEAWKWYQGELRGMPTDVDSFGLIHNDLHQENFHLDEGEIILIDFGACELSWFIYDIAISVYHAAQLIPVEGREEFIANFVGHFMAGYMRENQLAEYWNDKLHFFLKYRQIYSYLYLRKHLSTEFYQDHLDYFNQMEKEIKENYQNGVIST